MSKLFTTIQHSFRVYYKLSLNEYVVCDTIYYLSTRPDSKVLGWCYKTKANMGLDLGLSKQSIINIINSLIEKGFVIKDEETAFLKTTKKWNNVYENDGKESLPTVKEVGFYGKESLPDVGKESLPNNNSYNNNKEESNTRAKKSNKKESFIPPTLQEVKDYFKEKGYSQESAERAFEYYKTGEWKDGNGKKVINWKMKMLSVWMKPENKETIQNSQIRIEM